MASKDFHLCNLIRVQTSWSYLFLCLGVLVFTLATTANNRLTKVSKSRIGGFSSIFNCENKTYRMALILYLYFYFVKRDSSPTNPKRLEVVFSRRMIKIVIQSLAETNLPVKSVGIWQKLSKNYSI